MPAPTTVVEYLDLVRKSGVLEDKRLDGYLDKLRGTGGVPTEPGQLAGLMVRDGILTHFQAEQILRGKCRGFDIGKYRVLERLGAGGMGSVYLCEHKLMRRRVAVKVLPTAKAEDDSSRERFYREARAVAALDHPNIVRAYDIDRVDKLHFLVMEHVDGSNLQEIVKKTGPMEVIRAAHYIRQAALGLQHAHESAGIVHRDIKPGNVLVDRNGIVKILDMGLARFFHDEEDAITKQYDENVLGTADYLAPEQALDSHDVDIRADIYSLGATFYFCLTGRTPFAEGTAAQKLIWHQTRQPKPLRQLRPEVPEGIVAIVDKMMAKDPAQRYATPKGVADALGPWTQTPIAPPPESEMPQFSLAAKGGPGPSTSITAASRVSTGELSPSPRKVWQVPASPPPPSSQKAEGSRQKAEEGPPVPPQARGPAPAPAGSRSVTPQQPAVNGAARQAVAPAPAALTRPATPAPLPAVEDSPSWDKLSASDTEDRDAALDTAPRTSRKPGTTRKRPVRPSRAAVNPRRVWWVVGIASAVVLTGVGVLLYFALRPTPQAAPPEGPKPLYVNPDGSNGAYRSIQQAVDKAPRLGAHIIVQADVAEADVTVNNHKNLTIESEAGKTIVWKCPPAAAIPKVGTLKLLSVAGAEGFRLKGFKLDGGDRAKALIVLSGHCQGLVLDHLDLAHFQDYGIWALNCEGSATGPVVFANLHFDTPKDKSAVFFETRGNSITPNRHFLFRDCSFNGPGFAVRAPKTADLDLSTIKMPDKIKPHFQP